MMRECLVSITNKSNVLDTELERCCCIVLIFHFSVPSDPICCICGLLCWCNGPSNAHTHSHSVCAGSH